MSNPQQIQQYFNQAVQLMQRNDFPAALNILVALENTGWQDFRLYRLTGIAYERLQRHKLACEYFVRSLSGNPTQFDLFSSLARLKAQLHDYTAARSWHEKAVSSAPGKETFLKYATFLLTDAVNAPEEALVWLDKLDAAAADSEQARLLRARAYAMQNEPAKQFATLQSALSANPESKAVMQAMAWYHKEQGSDDDAAALFTQAAQHADATDKDWESLALFFLGSQQVEESLRVVRQGLTAFPQSRALLKLSSSLRYEMGDDNYLSEYRQLPLSRQPLPLALDYVDQSIKAAAHEQAADTLQALINQYGNNPTIYQRVALLAYEQQEYGKAIDTFHALSKHTPENENLKEWVVKSLIADGQYDNAQPFISQLLDAAPDNQIYWALQATQWRLTDDERYGWLCDYDTLVKTIPLVTPQGYSSTPAFLDDLKSVLVGLHATEKPPLEQTLRKGTQTTGNLLDNSHPVLQSLKQALHTTANAALADLPEDTTHPTLSRAGRKFAFSASWSVRLKNQGFHVSHVHPKGWYSSAFYVDLPDSISAADDDKAGWLHLGKPGVAHAKDVSADYWVKPEPGTLALFPSFVWHGTTPFDASQPRLTVAFDLRAGSQR